MFILSSLHWLLRTLNGETWGSGKHKSVQDNTVPSQDLPGIKQPEFALPPPVVILPP